MCPGEDAEAAGSPSGGQLSSLQETSLCRGQPSPAHARSLSGTCGLHFLRPGCPSSLTDPMLQSPMEPIPTFSMTPGPTPLPRTVLLQKTISAFLKLLPVFNQ